MEGWVERPLGADNLALFDYDNLDSTTPIDYRFRYITLENVNDGKISELVECVYRFAPSRARRIVHKGDILFATVRPLLHSHYIVNSEVNDIICSTGFCVVKTNETLLHNKYLYQLLFSWAIDNQIEAITAGSNYPAINSNDIKKLIIPIPPLPEQRAIAATLSDADAYIESLEKLIAKKRAVKMGVMGELLTGRRRLAGFGGEWVERRIGDIGEIVTGATPATDVDEYWNGEICWVTPTDITDNKDIQNVERKISEMGLSKIRELPPNTLLVTCIASIGKNAILRSRGASNQQINAIVPYDNYDVDFLYYLIEVNKSLLESKAGITATKIVSKAEFSEIEMSFPPTLKEQSAISQILTDMDSEIEALTAKRAKLQTLKQGMMSTLLTGQIRLVT